MKRSTNQPFYFSAYRLRDFNPSPSELESYELRKQGQQPLKAPGKLRTMAMVNPYRLEDFEKMAAMGGSR